MIFRRLQARGYDWEYAFPRLYAVDLGAPDEESLDTVAGLTRERERAELYELLEAGRREEGPRRERARHEDQGEMREDDGQRA
jgi:hypothetical protein